MDEILHLTLLYDFYGELLTEKQKQVFERFEKLNEYAQGTGLGLSICKLTVDKWGGDIWIDPDYEDGARFVVSHPL